MKVLLTNDDGYQALGLQTLCAVLAKEYEVYVAAPLKQQSSTGHSMTAFGKVLAKSVSIPGAAAAWAIDGTPVDAVKIGLEKFLNYQVDLVVSGINQGTNLGTDVFYSGTVGAACEGALLGVSALAVSLDSHDPEADYLPAAQLAKEIITKAFLPGQAEPLVLSLNVPALPKEKIKGIKAARLGVRRYYNGLKEQGGRQDAMEFVLNGTCEELSHRPDDDVQLLRQGYATLTPLSLERTDLARLADCKSIIGEAL